jgi:hypothetical protein
MARPERPVEGDHPLVSLARELRRARERARTPGYRELAETARFSRETLAAAARGKECPTWEVVRAFADACDPTGIEASRLRPLWQKARVAGDSAGRRRSSSPPRRNRRVAAAGLPPPVTRPSPVPGAPRPDPDGTAAEYVYQLRALRAWAGNPGYKETVRRLRHNLHMSRATFYGILSPSRATLPRLEMVQPLLVAYLRGDLDAVDEWDSAWRAISLREFTSANPRPGGQPAAGTHAPLRAVAS